MSTQRRTSRSSAREVVLFEETFAALPPGSVSQRRSAFGEYHTHPTGPGAGAWGDAVLRTGQSDDCWRVAADGDFKIGLSEVAIGLTLPLFACEFARDRLWVLARLLHRYQIIGNPLPTLDAILDDLLMQKPLRFRALHRRNWVFPNTYFAREDEPGIVKQPD